MIFACLLLMAAVAGGAFLTLVYQRQSTVIFRLCAGACTGLALTTAFGFLLSSFLGLTIITASLPAMLLLVPVLLLLRSRYRQQIRTEFKVGWQRIREQTSLRMMLVYVVLALVLGLVFSRNMLERPDGIYTGVANNLGDLPFHLEAISSFVYGGNIAVEDPTYSGARFTYPVLADFLTAMLIRVGASISAAMWWQNMILSLSFLGLLQYWALALTRDRLAAIFTPLLVIFSGGLGWWLLMQDLRMSDGSILALLAHLPHDYTITNSTIFRWGNSLTTLLLPERSFLFGLPLAVFVFYQWWQAIQFPEDGSSRFHLETEMGALPKNNPLPETAGTKGRKSVGLANESATDVIPGHTPIRETSGQEAAADNTRRMLAAGICAGLMPLIHAHGFVVVFGSALCLALLFRRMWHAWLIFLMAALLSALPGLIWLSHGSAVNHGKFLEWQPGWDHGNYNALWFWFVNTGLFIPLLLAAIFRRHSGYAIPKHLAWFYAPFALWFVLPNLLRLSPWIWDNIKLLFYWYVASVPLVAFLLAQVWRQGARRRWLAVGLVASLTLSGALDILRAISGASELREFARDGMETANLIKFMAPPRALVLHAPVWDSPVYLTGRRSLLGFSGWSWSRGLETGPREADINRIYSGSPAAKALLERYHVDYVLIGPSEAALAPDQAFWDTCSKLAQIGQYQLYKPDCKR